MRLNNRKPRPTILQPESISFLGPNLSTRNPASGPKTPDSSLWKTKATDVTAADQPKVSLIGLKKTVKP